MSKRLSHIRGDLHSLFLRIEELLAASTGADVFEETLKLVVAKLFDEVHNGTAFEKPDLQSLNGVLAQAAGKWRGVLPEEPALLLQAAPALACAAMLAPYTLHEQVQALDALFEMIVSKTAKGSKGQFFTPRTVVDFCVQLARPSSSDSILDPACGSGAFLNSALESGAGAVYGFDIDSRAVRIAKLLLLARGWYPSCIAQADALRTVQPASADMVLTNPPFAGDILDPELLKTFELARGRKRIERDALFLEKSVLALRPGGKLTIVLPHSKFAGAASRYIREWLFSHVEVLAVIGLGRNTFLPHTHQKANVLFAKRRTASVNGKPEPIFFAQSERDGKNSKGQPHGDDDLGEILHAYRAFAQGTTCP